MTVPQQPTVFQHTGNGVTTVFAFDCLVLLDDDLVVYLDGVLQASGYSISGLGVDSGGTVTFSAAPASSVIVTLSREVALERETDYQLNGDFRSPTVNNDFDRLWMALQGLGGLLARALRVSLFDPTPTADLVLPDADDRANQYLVFDADGAVSLSSGTGADIGLRADLASTNDAAIGADLVGFLRSGPAAVGRTMLDKARDYLSIGDDGATGSGSDELTEVQAAIDNAVTGSVVIPNGVRVTVSAPPSNPLGVTFPGGGSLAINETGGVRQLNTRFDHGTVIGREYLHRAYLFAKLQDGDRSTAPAGGSTSNLNVFLYGDSTAVGFVATTGPTPVANLPSYLWPNNALKRHLNANGLRYVTVTQRAVSGTSWRDLDALGDISSTTGLLVIKYGINDAAFSDQSGAGVIDPSAPVRERITAMAAEMRAKLAAIRAAATVAQLSIVLVGPTATADSVNGRNEEWYELVRAVYVQAARDYHCCFVDVYPCTRDARSGPSLWMDQPYGDGRTVHQTDTAMAQVWAYIVDQIFPRSAQLEWGAASFRNIGSNGAAEFANPATGPLGYLAGVTWERAQLADGFPKDGWLKTERFADGHTKQTLTPSNGLSGDGAAVTRQTGSTLISWTARWTGVYEAITPLASWVDFGTPTPTIGAAIDDQGFVQCRGSLKSGTTTPGTTIAALPSGMRPASTQYFLLPTTTGTPCQVSVDSTGAIVVVSGADATRTSLDAIRFRAG